MSRQIAEIFRIASEALRNAFKHSGAEQIEVSCATMSGRCAFACATFPM
jgi:signal transduction histidine kinase